MLEDDELYGMYGEAVGRIADEDQPPTPSEHSRRFLHRFFCADAFEYYAGARAPRDLEDAFGDRPFGGVDREFGAEFQRFV